MRRIHGGRYDKTMSIWRLAVSPFAPVLPLRSRSASNYKTLLCSETTLWANKRHTHVQQIAEHCGLTLLDASSAVLTVGGKKGLGQD